MPALTSASTSSAPRTCPIPRRSTSPAVARRSNWVHRLPIMVKRRSAFSRFQPAISAMRSTMVTSAHWAAAGPTACRAVTSRPPRTFSTAAITQVSSLRGRLGAFQTFTIGSTVNSLGVAFENVSAAESAILDTNFASETSNLTRNQILSQAATTVLAQANAQPNNVLKLLG